MSVELVKTLLVIEDDLGDARLLLEMLNEQGTGDTELTHVECMGDAEKYLATRTVDVILLDLGLPDVQGLEAVRRARAAAPSVPLVVMTGLDDESLAAQTLQEGAQDYLVKGQIETRELLRALRHAVKRKTMEETLSAEKAKITHSAQHDFLTGLPNRMLLNDRVTQAIASAPRHKKKVALLFLDLDGFKQINDSMGHSTDDKLLQSVAKRLVDCVRNSDTVCRQGGDEFVVLLSEVEQSEDAAITAQRMLQKVGDPYCIDQQDAITYTVKTLQGPAREKGVALSFEAPPLVPLVYVDPIRIRQILIILLDNGVKFTGTGGAVTVRTRVWAQDPRLMLVEVADSGCGIGPDMTERIFERLYQASNSGRGGRTGLGLGLYICKELVTRQGGEIWVTSSPQGSIFSLTMPIFSLAHLLSPLLKNEEWPGDSVALVTVEIHSPEGWLSKERREEWSRHTRSLLQRCILDDLDVLLPRMGTSGSEELFQVVAFADEQGVAVLTKRIHEQFQRMRHRKESGLIFSTSYRLAEPMPPSVHAPTEYLAGEMAARIEELIKSENTARAAHP